MFDDVKVNKRNERLLARTTCCRADADAQRHSKELNGMWRLPNCIICPLLDVAVARGDDESANFDARAETSRKSPSLLARAACCRADADAHRHSQVLKGMWRLPNCIVCPLLDVEVTQGDDESANFDARAETSRKSPPRRYLAIPKV